MDQLEFDRLARLLGGAGTRRAGLKAALALLALGGGDVALDAEARKRGGDGRASHRGKEAGRDGRRDRGARVEGPCGDGRRKANICTKDSQCCTGFCKKKLKNKDRKGRCRCVRRDGDCSNGQTCCGKMTCEAGRCGGSAPVIPAPTAAACAAGTTCAAPEAVCTAYTGEGAPEGTFCTLPLGARCTGDPDCTCYSCGVANPDSSGLQDRAGGGSSRADLVCCGREGIACVKDRNCCSGWLCVDGACTDCFPNVCPDCDYTTIQAAITALEGAADNVVMIAEGTYTEDLTITRSVTLRGCGDVTIRNATAGRRVIALPTSKPATAAEYINVELKNVHIATDTASPNFGGGIGGSLASNGDSTGGFVNLVLSGKTKVTGGRVHDKGGGIHTDSYSSLLMKDDSEVSGNSSDTYGGGGVYAYYSKVQMTGRSAVRNNVSKSGGGIYNYYGVTELAGSSTIAGNTSTRDGGGFTAYADSYGIPGNFGGMPILALKDESSIVDNTAFTASTSDATNVYTDDGGGASVQLGCDSGSGQAQKCLAVVMSGSSRISGNKAGTGPGKSGFGGGVGISDGDLILNDSASINGNYAWAVADGITGQQATLTYTSSTRAPKVVKNGSSTIGVECKIYNSVTKASTNC